MSLQFVIGNAGSGKSTYLYRHVIAEAIKHPPKKLSGYRAGTVYHAYSGRTCGYASKACDHEH